MFRTEVYVWHGSWDNNKQPVLHPVLSLRRLPPRSALFPYTTLFRSREAQRPDKSSMAFVSAQSAEEQRFARSEEHTSELQSRRDLVCRLLLEKKKKRMRQYKSTVADKRQ